MVTYLALLGLLESSVEVTGESLLECGDGERLMALR